MLAYVQVAKLLLITVSFTIWSTVATLIRNVIDRLLKDSPVAKYLENKGQFECFIVIINMILSIPSTNTYELQQIFAYAFI